jgi:hypothetical protein
MIRCILHPLAPAFRVHGEYFQPGNYHPHDRDADLFAGQVHDDDPVQSLLPERFDDVLDILFEIVGIG